MWLFLASASECEAVTSDDTVAPNDSTLPSPNGRPRSGRVEAIVVVGLLLILTAGAYFRFVGLNWDDNHHLHPDERFLTIVASQISGVDNPLDYLRTSVSTLNPYNFDQGFYVYGNFPMTVTRYAAEWTNGICDMFASEPEPDAFCAANYTGYDGVFLVGRFLSGLVDLVSVFFTFLIARRLYNWQAGLVAAFLLAVAVMPIQQSHFFTMDNWAAALCTVALYAAVRAAGLGDAEVRWRLSWFVLFGVALGLAAASRVNVAPIALVINVSAVIWLAQRGHSWRTVFSSTGSSDLQRMVVGVLLAAVVSLLMFRVAQPYAFADREMIREAAMAATGEAPGELMLTLRSLVQPNPQWLGNMAEIQRLQEPEASFPPALQWTDRAPLLFPFSNMVLYGMGLTAGLFAWLAFFWAIWRMLHRDNRWGRYPEWMVHAIPVFWVGLYFLYMGTRWVKSVRYFLPIYPALFILAGWALVYLWQRAGMTDRLRQQPARWRRWAVAGLTVLIVAPSFLWALTFTQIYREPVTRVAASEWIFENVPTGATLIYEVDGETRTLQLPVKGYFLEHQGAPLVINFNMPEDGVIQGVRFNYLDDGDATIAVDDPEILHVSLNGGLPISQSLQLDEERLPAQFDFEPVIATAGSAQQIVAEAGAGGPVRLTTSLLANEHWDDLLPVSTGGRNAYGAYYTEVAGGQRPVTHPDSPQKLDEVLAWLDEADYIMLSSQRAMWHLPRLPLTYPLMIRYYDALFSGELGFELAAEFHGNLRLGPLFISDTSGQIGWGEPPEVGWPPPNELAAEEAFSVYDHPPVWILRKTDAYDPAKTQEVLGSVDLSQVLVMNPLEATQAPGGLMLPEVSLAAQRTAGSFADLFGVDGALANNPWLAALVWVAAVVLIGWLAFPIAFVALGGLPDRGYALARVIGLLLLAYIPWLFASTGVLPFTRGTILLALLLIGGLSLLLAWGRRGEISRFVRENAGYIGLVELLALGLFALMIVIRLGNPDVWDVIWGGEKPMDLTYFTAVLKAETFPPYDPWFAGGYINYYYFGFVFVGALTELLGIPPTIAYNLILPMLFSFTGVAVFSLAYGLVRALSLERFSHLSALRGGSVVAKTGSLLRQRALIAGLIAMALALLVGNLAQTGVVVNAWYQTGSPALEEIPVVGSVARTIDGGIRIVSGQPAAIYPGDWFWTATRAINTEPGEVQPITEFPYFTFLYGDLHAHMISMPLTLLALGWGIALALSAALPGRAARGRGSMILETAVLGAIGVITIGSLRATNTWDWPTYLLLGSIAVLYYVFRRSGRFDLRSVGQAIFLVAALVGLSTLAFWPFAANYGTGYSSVSLWQGSYSHLWNYLLVYGLFLFFVLSHLAREFRSWTRSWTTTGLEKLEAIGWPLVAVAGLLVVLLAVMLWRGYWIAPLVVPLILVSGLLALRPGLETARRIVLVLIAAALGLTMMVEVIVLDGDIGRMNTVFKFYMQSWLMLSVACGPAAVWAWPAVRARTSVRPVWVAGLAILVAGALLYPLLATPAKWNIRMNAEAPNTLDGMAFMPYVEYGDVDYLGNGLTIRLADDYDAIRWMQRNIEGTPVIAEAHGGNPYRSVANRVAMYTGLPAIVGWDWHQRQQRAVLPGNLVTDRINDVNTLYNTTDLALAEALLEKYSVGYVYVGALENAYYFPEGLAKFDRLVETGVLREVYRDETARILEVVRTEETEANAAN